MLGLSLVLRPNQLVISVKMNMLEIDLSAERWSFRKVEFPGLCINMPMLCTEQHLPPVPMQCQSLHVPSFFMGIKWNVV